MQENIAMYYMMNMAMRMQIGIIILKIKILEEGYYIDESKK